MLIYFPQLNKYIKNQYLIIKLFNNISQHKKPTHSNIIYCCRGSIAAEYDVETLVLIIISIAITSFFLIENENVNTKKIIYIITTPHVEFYLLTSIYFEALVRSILCNLNN